MRHPKRQAPEGVGGLDSRVGVGTKANCKWQDAIEIRRQPGTFGRRVGWKFQGWTKRLRTPEPALPPAPPTNRPRQTPWKDVNRGFHRDLHRDPPAAAFALRNKDANLGAGTGNFFLGTCGLDHYGEGNPKLRYVDH